MSGPTTPGELAPASPVVDDSDSPISPRGRASRPRRSSSVSRVSVGYFDPVGVQELRRALSRRSTNDLERISTEKSTHDRPYAQNSESLAASSTITLTGFKVDEGLDFEKTIRRIVRK